MVEAMEDVLAEQLIDDEGNPLVRDKEHKVIAEQASGFKLDELDIRSPERKAEVEKAYKTALERRRGRSSTRRSVSSTR